MRVWLARAAVILLGVAVGAHCHLTLSATITPPQTGPDSPALASFGQHLSACGPWLFVTGKTTSQAGHILVYYAPSLTGLGTAEAIRQQWTLPGSIGAVDCKQIAGTTGNVAVFAVSTAQTVHIFLCSAAIATAMLPCRLHATLNAPTSTNSFGYAVALEQDGVAVAAPTEKRVFVYRCSFETYENATGVCTLAHTLLNDLPRFGESLSWANGTLAVGTYLNDWWFGRASVYRCQPNSFCQLLATFGASDGQYYDYFGKALTSGPHHLVVVGAIRDTNVPGKVYVFDCSVASCVQVDSFNSPEPFGNDWFGHRVALLGHLLVVNAPAPRRSISGTVYVYDCEQLPCTLLQSLRSGTIDVDEYGSSLGLVVPHDGSTSSSLALMVAAPRLNRVDMWTLCAPNTFGSTCTPCTSCQHGVCTTGPSGGCNCTTGWAGADCDVCSTGFYGPSCADRCSDCQGLCTEGRTGGCGCERYWENPPSCDTPSGFTGFSQSLLTRSVFVSYSAHLADLDLDGDDDVLSSSDSDGKVAIYPNFHSGTGGGPVTMGEQRVIGTISGAWYIGIGDLDGDGLPDLVSGGWNGAPRWYRNLGSLQFAAGVQLGSFSDIRYIEVVDLDGNGVLDLCTSSDVTNVIRLFRNNRLPSGTVASFTELAPLGANAYSAIVKDLDADGLPDFVYIDAVDSSRVVWRKNLGAFSFAAPADVVRLPEPFEGVRQLNPVLVDYDDDGDLDLLIACQNVVGGGDVIFYFESLAMVNGTHRPAPISFGVAIMLMTAAPGRIAVADVDGDGLLDLIVGSTSLFWLRRRTLSPPSFGRPIHFGTVPSTWMVTFMGDLNRDGLPDGVVASPFPYEHSQINLFVNQHTLSTPTVAMPTTTTPTPSPSNSSPEAACPAHFARVLCDACAAGHFGENCTKCVCVFGECDQGRNGTGACTCESAWQGDACDILQLPSEPPPVEPGTDTPNVPVCTSQLGSSPTAVQTGPGTVTVTWTPPCAGQMWLNERWIADDVRPPFLASELQEALQTFKLWIDSYELWNITIQVIPWPAATTSEPTVVVTEPQPSTAATPSPTESADAVPQTPAPTATSTPAPTSPSTDHITKAELLLALGISVGVGAMLLLIILVASIVGCRRWYRQRKLAKTKADYLSTLAVSMTDVPLTGTTLLTMPQRATSTPLDWADPSSAVTATSLSLHTAVPAGGLHVSASRPKEHPSWRTTTWEAYDSSSTQLKSASDQSWVTPPDVKSMQW